MRVRRLDKNHDWTFGNNHSNYATHSEAIYQSVKCRLLSVTNNWFLDFDHGVNWPKYFRKNPNYRNMEMEIKQTVLKTKGVVEITDFALDLNINTRHCVVTVSYNDTFGKNQKVEADVTGNQ